MSQGLGCSQEVGSSVWVWRAGITLLCPPAPGLWWMSSHWCPSPRLRSQCTRWSALTLPASRRRKASTSQSASRSSLSPYSSKVSVVPLFPRAAAHPNVGLWLQNLSSFNWPSHLPRAPGCQPHIHAAVRWPSDPEPRPVSRGEKQTKWHHSHHPGPVLPQILVSLPGKRIREPNELLGKWLAEGQAACKEHGSLSHQVFFLQPLSGQP